MLLDLQASITEGRDEIESAVAQECNTYELPNPEEIQWQDIGVIKQPNNIEWVDITRMS